MPLLRLDHMRLVGSQARHASTNSVNSVHHATGSPRPDIHNDKLTLINMRFCPYAQRTVLCLNAKGVDYEVVNCALLNKPEWLLDINPIGKVPVLMHQGHTIYESLITCDYVDQVFPGQSLHSADPARRARDKMMVELFNKVVMPQTKIVFGWKIGQGEQHRAGHWSKAMQSLDPLEQELVDRKTRFFGGDNLPGYLDYMIWPWMERIKIFPSVFQGEPRLAYDPERFPILTSWMSHMKEDPAVQQYLLDDDTHAQFFRSMVSGSPAYNMLLGQ